MCLYWTKLSKNVIKSQMERQYFNLFWVCILAFIVGVVIKTWSDIFLVAVLILASLFLLIVLLKFSFQKLALALFLVVAGFLYAPDYNQPTIFKSKESNNSKIAIQLSSRLNNILNYPYSELAKGIAYGDDAKIPSDIKQDFRKIGLSHILAVSGSNIAILIGFVSIFLLPLAGRRFYVVGLTLLLLFFLSLTGFESSILRATIMAMSLILGTLVGRQSVGLFALFFAGFLMILYEPSIIRYDIGFQLSFMATLGLSTIYPYLVKRLNIENIKNIFLRFFSQTFLTTISAQLATLVIIWPKFGMPSWVSMPANLLIAPLAPYVMIITIIILIFSTFSTLLAQVLAFLIYLLLEYMLIITRFLA